MASWRRAGKVALRRRPDASPTPPPSRAAPLPWRPDATVDPVPTFPAHRRPAPWQRAAATPCRDASPSLRKIASMTTRPVSPTLRALRSSIGLALAGLAALAPAGAYADAAPADNDFGPIHPV